MSIDPLHIIGGGLAGSEAAWQAAQMGVPVILHEMRPHRGTEAHQAKAWPSLSVPTRFAPMIGSIMRLGYCMPKCGAAAR